MVFVAVLGTVFVNLGEWQLDRLDQRQQRNRDTLANEANPVVPYEQVFTRPSPRPTSGSGWRPGAPSTPSTSSCSATAATAGRTATRWSPRCGPPPARSSWTAGSSRLEKGQPIPSAAPAPPAGEVTVTGHVRRDERGRGAATRPVDGQMRLVSSTAIAPTLPYPVANGYIGLLSVDPAQSGGFETVQLPEISDGPHFWYAVQWFMFTAIGLAGVVVFIRGDLRARREERAAAAAAGAGPGPEPADADAGADQPRVPSGS